MINTVWFLLITIGILCAIGTGKISLISNIIFTSSAKAIEFTLGLAGLIAFWSGILKIAETAGITAKVAQLFQPILKLLFPKIAPQNPVLGLVSLTIAANLLGLGNVATPLGLQTMKELQKLNHCPERASDEICTFLALLLGGLSLVPTTLIAIRAQAGSNMPAFILAPVALVSLLGTITALSLNYLAQRISYRRIKRGE